MFNTEKHDIAWEDADRINDAAAIIGFTIADAAIVDDPNTRAIILFLTGADGSKKAVYIGADTDNYLSTKEAIISHKSERQHKQFMELDETAEQETAPLYMLEAGIDDNENGATTGETGA